MRELNGELKEAKNQSLDSTEGQLPSASVYS